MADTSRLLTQLRKQGVKVTFGKGVTTKEAIRRAMARQPTKVAQAATTLSTQQQAELIQISREKQLTQDQASRLSSGQASTIKEAREQSAFAERVRSRTQPTMITQTIEQGLQVQQQPDSITSPSDGSLEPTMTAVGQVSPPQTFTGFDFGRGIIEQANIISRPGATIYNANVEEERQSRIRKLDQQLAEASRVKLFEKIRTFKALPSEKKSEILGTDITISEGAREISKEIKKATVETTQPFVNFLDLISKPIDKVITGIEKGSTAALESGRFDITARSPTGILGQTTVRAGLKFASSRSLREVAGGTKDFLIEQAQDPATLILSGGSGFAFKAATSVGGKVVTKISTNFPKIAQAIKIGTGAGLGTLGGLAIGTKAAEFVSAEGTRGKTKVVLETATEFAAFKKGSDLFDDAVESTEKFLLTTFRKNKYINPKEVFDPNVLKQLDIPPGKRVFPTSKTPEIALQKFQSSIGRSGKIEVITATGRPANFQKILSPSELAKGLTEDPGAYVAPLRVGGRGGGSPRFLRISQKEPKFFEQIKNILGDSKSGKNTFSRLSEGFDVLPQPKKPTAATFVVERVIKPSKKLVAEVGGRLKSGKKDSAFTPVIKQQERLRGTGTISQTVRSVLGQTAETEATIPAGQFAKLIKGEQGEFTIVQGKIVRLPRFKLVEDPVTKSPKDIVQSLFRSKKAGSGTGVSGRDKLIKVSDVISGGKDKASVPTLVTKINLSNIFPTDKKVSLPEIKIPKVSSSPISSGNFRNFISIPSRPPSSVRFSIPSSNISIKVSKPSFNISTPKIKVSKLGISTPRISPVISTKKIKISTPKPNLPIINIKNFDRNIIPRRFGSRRIIPIKRFTRISSSKFQPSIVAKEFRIFETTRRLKKRLKEEGLTGFGVRPIPI